MEKSLQDLLGEKLSEKGLDLARLKSQTGISPRFLDAIFSGDHKNLPALPYVRGYVVTLAKFLGVEFEELWGVYKDTLELRQSGVLDELPRNRFAIKTINIKSLSIFSLVLLIILYFSVQAFNHFKSVELALINFSDNSLTISTSTFLVLGKTNPEAKVLIDNEEVLVDEDGGFSKKIELNSGINMLKVSAKKLFGSEKVLEREIIYEPISDIVEEESINDDKINTNQ
ncbi:MAG: helix-turn-helix domain-containing protein [Candidatus Pacebacteria bacterium]|nr:helix-turn-helix domain-containing protein [Candidatus Paceibacterota bacterium]